MARPCETLWSAREIASVALSVERERHTETVFHMLLKNFILWMDTTGSLTELRIICLANCRFVSKITVDKTNKYIVY